MSVAVVHDRFGGPEVLRVVDLEVPVPGPGQVVVHQRVVGVNPADAKRLAGLFGGARFPASLGFEASGTVTAVGEDVAGLAPGDEVLWHGTGAQREHALVRADHVLHRPATVSPEQAAVLPVAAAVAFSALAQVGAGRGDTVLVHGASGGVGSAAVQVARALGARVVGTSSTARLDHVAALGAQALPHDDDLVAAARALGGVSAVVDLVGRPETVAATTALLGADLSRAVTTASSPATRAVGVPDLVDRKGALREVLALAEAGRLRAEITGRYPLERAADAVRTVAAGHVRGKLVLVVRPS